MVKERWAYEAADGKIFDTEWEALRHDAYLQLSKLQIFNHASAMGVIDNYEVVCKALQPLLDSRNRPASENIVDGPQQESR